MNFNDLDLHFNQCHPHGNMPALEGHVTRDFHKWLLRVILSNHISVFLHFDLIIFEVLLLFFYWISYSSFFKLIRFILFLLFNKALGLHYNPRALYHVIYDSLKFHDSLPFHQEQPRIQAQHLTRD